MRTKTSESIQSITMAAKKTWLEKLNVKKEPKVKRIDFDFADIPANSTMLIATPKIVEDYIKQIPKGKQASIRTMRKDLAGEYHADYTCPLTAGIFLRIVAEANYEKYSQTNSLKGIAPFWRMIEPGSSLAQKLTFGQELITKQRKAEGLVEL
jgi:hypothetical protein